MQSRNKIKTLPAQNMLTIPRSCLPSKYLVVPTSHALIIMRRECCYAEQKYKKTLPAQNMLTTQVLFAFRTLLLCPSISLFLIYCSACAAHLIIFSFPIFYFTFFKHFKSQASFNKILYIYNNEITTVLYRWCPKFAKYQKAEHVHRHSKIQYTENDKYYAQFKICKL